MFASAVLGYALVADSDTVVLVSTVGAAVIGAIVTIITTMMSNASANRRQRRELAYRGQRPSVIGLPFVVTLMLIIAAIYLVTRPSDETKVASEPPVPATTIVSAPTPITSAPLTAPTSTIAAATTAPSAAPACAPFTVQIAAIEKVDLPNVEFEAQARVLMESLPQLGGLHSDVGDACGASDFRQFYFGPFSDGDAARDTCFAIGQVLHDNSTMYTEFQSPQGEINYPYYRITQGVQARDINGVPLLCAPDAA